MQAGEAIAATSASLKQVRIRFEIWISQVALAAQDLLDRFRAPKTLSLIEPEEGSVLRATAGLVSDSPCALEELNERMHEALKDSSVDLELCTTRFIVREIDVPPGASDVISGVVRAQVEKLMPWNLESMVYGWAGGQRNDSDRLKVVIAGCAFESLRPVVEELSSSGARSFSLSVRVPGTESLIEIWNEEIGRRTAPEPLCSRLKLALTGVAAFAVVALVADAAVSALLRPDELVRQVAQARLRHSGPNLLTTASGDPVLYKRTGPAAIITLEDVSKLLPDGSYLSELRTENGKLWISGKSKDAASLLVLFGQSARFSAARFFAPTSHTEDDGSEVFHIEATINPRADGKI